MNEREKIYEAALRNIAHGSMSSIAMVNTAQNALASATHDLWKDGDDGIPDALLDRNGQVVLGQCKNCKRAEMELTEPCDAPTRPAPPMPTIKSPLATQIGGTHYKGLAIQPVEYIHANGLPFCEGSIVKYVTRHRSKGGLADLEKAKHFIELLIDLETRK